MFLVISKQTLMIKIFYIVIVVLMEQSSANIWEKPGCFKVGMKYYFFYHKLRVSVPVVDSISIVYTSDNNSLMTT